MKRIKNFCYILKQIFKISPSYISLLFFTTIISILRIFAMIYLPRLLIIEIIAGNSRQAYMLALVNVVANCLLLQIRLCTDFAQSVQSKYLENKIRGILSLKMARINYQYVEDPYYLELSARAFFAFDNQQSLNQIFLVIPIFFKSLIAIIGLMAVIFIFDPLLLAVAGGSIFLTAVITTIGLKLQHGVYNNIIPINRKSNYYTDHFFSQELAKQIRVNGMFEMIKNRSKDYHGALQKTFRRFGLVSGLMDAGVEIVNIFQLGITYLILALKKLPVADFLYYSGAATTIATEFNQLLSSIFSINVHLKYLEPFIELQQLKEQQVETGNIELEEIQTLEFRNVDFHYPRTDNLILKDISFKVIDGQKTAIVGLNGAGKSTLVKLLCRFFEPTSGTILINDIDIRQYHHQTLINAISAVFQDAKLFPLSIRENLDPSGKKSLTEIRLTLGSLGIEPKIASLPQREETIIGKTITDGTLLSGGQEQLLAIGRAMLKNPQLIILDEPTSALDPLAEAEIYHRFNQISNNKMTIYISHRMSSAQFCDKILVIDNGQVIAYDSHNELMKDNESLYYRLFSAQAEYYQKNHSEQKVNNS